MFEPPRDLMFKGDLEAAKEAALAQSKWLVRRLNWLAAPVRRWPQQVVTALCAGHALQPCAGALMPRQHTMLAICCRVHASQLHAFCGMHSAENRACTFGRCMLRVVTAHA